MEEENVAKICYKRLDVSWLAEITKRQFLVKLKKKLSKNTNLNQGMSRLLGV